MKDSIPKRHQPIEKIDGASISVFMETQIDSYRADLERVFFLTILYSDLKNSKEFASSSKIDDVLRAAVVLTHATLEEFLRLLASEILPNADEHVINRIPLASSSTSGRPEKFFLGSLTKFRGKTIDEVISQSVIDYLDYLSFSNTNDIAFFLKDLGLDMSEIEPYFPELQKLIQRRHQIVHKVDKLRSQDDKVGAVPEIDPTEVKDWVRIVVEFINAVLYEAVLKMVQNKVKLINH